MARWCPRCGAEYVEGWGTCSQCGEELVAERPRKRDKGFDPDDAIFIEPRAARTYEDPFVPIWEGATPEADQLARRLEGAHIPVDLGEALEPGHARLEVPRSYIAEAYGVLDEAGLEPLPAPAEHRWEEPEEELGWPPAVRVALVLIAVLLIVALVATSRY